MRGVPWEKPVKNGMPGEACRPAERTEGSLNAMESPSSLQVGMPSPGDMEIRVANLKRTLTFDRGLPYGPIVSKS